MERRASGASACIAIILVMNPVPSADRGWSGLAGSIVRAERGSVAEERMAMDAELAREILLVADEAAEAARGPALEWFRAPEVSVTDKGGPRRFDPVTIADRNAEEAIREVIARRRPEDAVIGEEFGEVSGTSGIVWVIDPIDGTRSFLSGLPLWTVLIGVHDGENAVVGVVDQPYLEERYWGITVEGLREAGAVRRGARSPLKTRSCGSVGEAAVGTTSRDSFEREADYLAYREIALACRYTRLGCDAYMYAMLADGRMDLVIEADLQAYDIMALIPVVEGAGGRLTDWSGGDPCWGGQSFAAGDLGLHAQVLKNLPDAAG